MGARRIQTWFTQVGFAVTQSSSLYQAIVDDSLDSWVTDYPEWVNRV